MSNSKDCNCHRGAGFFILTFLFIGLKIGHVIDWSWVWVLSPLWLPFAVVIVAVIFCVVVAWLISFLN